MSPPDPRPLVALINNVQTPYRLFLHRRFAREMPRIRIASIYTHEVPDQPWEAQVEPEINPVYFGRGQSVVEQSRPKWMLTDWRKGGAIIRWMTEHDTRAVLIGGYNDLTRLRIIRWCRAHRLPCFLVGDANIKGDTARGLKRLAKNAFVPRAVRACTGVMPCGTLGAQFFARYGAAPDRTYFLPYEPDYSLVSGIPPATVTAALSRFNLDPGRKRLVVCARLVPVKRVDLAIDAFAAIAAQRPDWDLVIIGDGALRHTLAGRTPPALTSRVTWTGFLGDQAVISALYVGSHILVCPSDYEPWGVVINEAAAAGMAIVATDVVGAAAELVRDGVNGRIVPAGDLPALTGALLEVTDPARTASWRAASAAALADWRRRGDPVAGLTRALTDCGVLR